MKALGPNARQTIKSYYQVQAEVIEDSDELCIWAKRAIGYQTKKK